MHNETKTNPWVILFRVIFTAGLLLTVIFIFTRSFKDGFMSNKESERVLLLMQKVLTRLTDREITMHFVRKLAHFTEFTVLGGLSQFCLRVYTKHYVRHISYPLLFCLMVALADETIQLGMVGRSSSVVDVWLDYSGVLFGVTCALMVLAMFHALGLFILHDWEDDL